MTTESLLSDFVLYVVPVLNPDGYAHTWTAPESGMRSGWDWRRMWRKNRRPLTRKEVADGLNRTSRRRFRTDPEFKDKCTGKKKSARASTRTSGCQNVGENLGKRPKFTICFL